MATMFVQLRGVVYLLVLLQCCACAAYPGAPAHLKSYDLKRPAYGEDYIRETKEHVAYWKGAIQELKTKMEKEKGEVDAALQAFNIAKNKYNTTVEKAEEKCKPFTKDVNGGTPNLASNEGETGRELRKQCALAVNEVVSASEEMVERANDRVAVAEKYNATVFELYKKSHDYKYFISAVAEGNTHYALDSRNAEKDVDVFRKLKTAAKRVRYNATRDKRAAVEDYQALKKAVGEAEKFLEDATKSPETVVEKVVPVVQRMRRDLDSVDNTTESLEEEHEEEEHEEVHLPEHELRTAENTTTAKQQNEPHVLYENIRGDGSMERTVATNAQTAAEKLKTHNVQTESHSTSTVHINISGFIDGTSSPALAHSSMLLLVLLCVLGYTLVC